MAIYFTNFTYLSNYLNGQIECDPLVFFISKYKIYYLPVSDSNIYRLRIEEADWGIFPKYRPIGSIDLIVNKEKKQTEIKWWMVNDKWLSIISDNMYGPPLDYIKSHKIFKLLFTYAERIAKENNCEKIKRDVHYSLKEYNLYLKNFEFKLTNEKADDHFDWLKTYKTL